MAQTTAIMGRPKMTAKEFWSKVDKNGPVPEHKPELGPCWLWTGCTNTAGYGATSWNYKYTQTHRLAYQLTHGEIPEGLNCLHRCDNPRCCNAESHLFLGTNQNNADDMVEKNRQSQGAKHSAAILPNRPRGEENAMHKTTNEDVVEMRRLYAETKIPIPEIAAQFRLSEHTAEKAIRGETWKHLPRVEIRHKRNAKLAPETVQEIRRLRTSGITCNALAAQFHLSIFTINDIVYRRTWRDLK
jgi:hypothetical protein